MDSNLFIYVLQYQTNLKAHNVKRTYFMKYLQYFAKNTINLNYNKMIWKLKVDTGSTDEKI